MENNSRKTEVAVYRASFVMMYKNTDKAMKLKHFLPYKIFNARNNSKIFAEATMADDLEGSLYFRDNFSVLVTM